MKRLIKHTLAIVTVIMLAVVLVPAYAAAGSPTAEEQLMIDLINTERAKIGVAPLTMHSGLMDSARIKSKDMAENVYFGHNSPTLGKWSDIIRSLGISMYATGENIQRRIDNSSTLVQDAHNAFMNSSGHRKNILNPLYTHVGISVYRDAYGRVLFTQHFGKPGQSSYGSNTNSTWQGSGSGTVTQPSTGGSTGGSTDGNTGGTSQPSTGGNTGGTGNWTGYTGTGTTSTWRGGTGGSTQPSTGGNTGGTSQPTTGGDTSQPTTGGSSTPTKYTWSAGTSYSWHGSN